MKGRGISERWDGMGSERWDGDLSLLYGAVGSQSSWAAAVYIMHPCPFVRDHLYTQSRLGQGGRTGVWAVGSQSNNAKNQGAPNHTS